MECQSKPILVNIILRETGRQGDIGNISTNIQGTEFKNTRGKSDIKKIISF